MFIPIGYIVIYEYKIKFDILQYLQIKYDIEFEFHILKFILSISYIKKKIVYIKNYFPFLMYYNFDIQYMKNYSD